MARLSSIPRDVLEAAWRAGLQGRRIQIPLRTSRRAKQAEVVRDLLSRAERRVVETGDVRRDTIVGSWASAREEGERLRVAHSLVWRAAREAESLLLSWWRDGERERQQRLRAAPDPVAVLSEYQQARREIRAAGSLPGNVRPWILALASDSVASAWWGRSATSPTSELEIAEEVACLAVLMMEGRIGPRAGGSIAGVRLGVSTEMAAQLAHRIELGIARAEQALAAPAGDAPEPSSIARSSGERGER